MVDVPLDRILFYYAEYQEGYKSGQYGRNRVKIEFREGLPKAEDYSLDPELKKLIIIDDMMREQNSVIVDLFTKGSHHKNISIMFLTQNIFHKSSHSRDVSLNASYIVLFKNPRDRAQVSHVARQIFPQDSKFLIEAYQNATQEPHEYLLIDCNQNVPDEFRFRAKIFPDDEFHYVYVPKHTYTPFAYTI